MKELSEIEIVESLQIGLIEKAKVFSGTGIFMPTFKELAEVSGIPISQLYFRSKPEDKVAAATGKRIISGRPWGYLLGDAEQLRPLEQKDLPQARASVDLDELTAVASKLTEEDRQELARRIVE